MCFYASYWFVVRDSLFINSRVSGFIFQSWMDVFQQSGMTRWPHFRHLNDHDAVRSCGLKMWCSGVRGHGVKLMWVQLVVGSVICSDYMAHTANTVTHNDTMLTFKPQEDCYTECCFLLTSANILSNIRVRPTLPTYAEVPTSWKRIHIPCIARFFVWQRLKLIPRKSIRPCSVDFWGMGTWRLLV